jgi:hypothetical protein
MEDMLLGSVIPDDDEPGVPPELDPGDFDSDDDAGVDDDDEEWSE